MYNDSPGIKSHNHHHHTSNKNGAAIGAAAGYVAGGQSHHRGRDTVEGGCLGITLSKMKHKLFNRNSASGF